MLTVFVVEVCGNGLKLRPLVKLLAQMTWPDLCPLIHTVIRHTGNMPAHPQGHNTSKLLGLPPVSMTAVSPGLTRTNPCLARSLVVIRVYYQKLSPRSCHDTRIKSSELHVPYPGSGTSRMGLGQRLQRLGDVRQLSPRLPTYGKPSGTQDGD
ncbi:hypothetical protein LZ32DRAFT_149596 [Colletotrichum eremochloae]|nr:hypothetical protein LZ32DRAFT_149596 [Colletotrichum eremochloae]